jgi:hypothetical protein
MRPVFFREDDDCQVEVLPAAAHHYCSQEMGRIDEFAATPLFLYLRESRLERTI